MSFLYRLFVIIGISLNRTLRQDDTYSFMYKGVWNKPLKWWERLIENHHDAIYHSTVLYTYLYCSFSNSLELAKGLEPLTYCLQGNRYYQLSYASLYFSFLYDLSLGLSFSVIYFPVRKDIFAFGADFLIKSIPLIVPIFSFISSHLV